jgi:hypothetical protein
MPATHEGDMLSRDMDAFGHLVHDHHRGIPSPEIIERDDGWFGVASVGVSSVAYYFAPCCDRSPE